MAGDPTRALVARLHGPRDIRLHDEARPAPTPGEVLVRVTAVGLCGSDLHWFEDGAIGDARLERPLVLGHEIAGVVEGGPNHGQRVVLDPADPCTTCRTCRAGHPESCPTARFAGYGASDGGLRTWMAWPERLTHRLPDATPDADASLLEALGVALHAIDLAGVAPGMRCAVIGAGPIGQLVIRALRAAGLDDVVASDRLEHRVEAARHSGAAAAWLATDDPADDANRIGEVDVAIECAGEDPAVEVAIRVTHAAGRVVLVGIPSPDRTTFPAAIARRKGLTLVLCRRMRPSDLAEAIRLVAEGSIPLRGLVTDRVPLADAPAAFAALAARHGMKVCVID